MEGSFAGIPFAMFRRSIHRFLLCGVITLCGNASIAASQAPLRVVFSSSWAMPFAEIEGTRVTGGLILDIAQSVGQLLDRPVVPLVLPRKRIANFESAGAVDLGCYANPVWTESPGNYVWSPPLFDVVDVLFGSATSPNPRTLDGLPSKSTVSTVLGYRYALLEKRFEDGMLLREDTVDQYRVFLKVSAGRTPYGISNTLSLIWYRNRQSSPKLADWQMEVGRVAFYCAVPKKSALPADQILNALATLKANGTLARILKKYE